MAVTAVARGGPGADDGAVTAELAVLMPAIVLLVAVVLAAGAAGLGRLRALDGAEAAARQLARGESTSEARSTARQVAGDGADVAVHRHVGWVSVTVTPDGPRFVVRLLSFVPAATVTTRLEKAP